MVELIPKTFPQYDAAGPVIGNEVMLLWQDGRVKRLSPASFASYVVSIGSELLATSATPIDLDAIGGGEGEGEDEDLGQVQFITQIGKGFVPGDVVIAATTTPGTFIRGIVSSYVGAVLVMDVGVVAGTGVYNGWTIRAEVSTQLSTALALKADIDSPEFAGFVRAPTRDVGDDTTGVATTAFVARAVTNAIGNLINSAPEALDTLAELAAALGDDANFAATIAGELAALNGKVLPPGTTMLFIQANPPTGWTKSLAHNNKALRIVSGAGGGSGGSVAFSTVFGRTTTGARTLTTATMPVHDHPLTFLQKDKSGAGNNVSDFKSSGNSDSTGNRGGGGSHNHDMDMRVQYVDAIIAVKD